MVTSAENPASENSPQSIGELRNGQVAENYNASLVRKMAKIAYKILLYVLILKFLKLRCVSLIDDGQYTQNELGMGN